MRIIKTVVPMIAASAIVTTSAMSATWRMDVPHTSIGFTVTHLVVTKVHGKFDDFSGTIQFDENNMENGTIDVTIQTTSIDTDNERRDNHLRSPDFFDVENYPVMTFKSKKIVKKGDNEFEIVGDLTIRDITKEITLDAELNGIINDPQMGTRAGFSATGKINRMDFGVKWNKAIETGGLVVAEEVIINIETELVKEK